MVLLAGLPVWDASNGFGGWGAKRNCEVSSRGGNLVMTILAKDPQLEFTGLAIDAAECNMLSYTYRAKGKIDQGGQMYYASATVSYNDNCKWSLPVPVTDGQWHTVNLPTSTMGDPWNWTSAGMITSLRFDPTDADNGVIEFSEIKLSFDKSFPINQKPLPPLVKAEPQLDGPEWSAITPEYDLVEPIELFRNYPYFTAKMVTSPDDKQGQGDYNRFSIRREAYLREKPVLAMIQYTADDWAYCYANGHHVATANNWRQTFYADVTGKLHAGNNVFGITYINTGNVGGTIGELFVRYADGTCEYFNTDETCITAPTETLPNNWNTPEYVPGNEWSSVITAAAPPNPPWNAVLAYRDYAHQSTQKFLSSSVESKDPLMAGDKVHVVLTYEGEAPKATFLAKVNLYSNGDVLWDEEREFTTNEIKVLDENHWQLIFDYETPLYSSTRDCILEITSNKFEEPATLKFTITGQKAVPGFEKKPSFKVTQNGWGPCFTLNGKQIYPLWGGMQRPNRPDHIARHNDGPVDINTLYVVYPMTWQGVDVFSTVEYDRQAEAYRRANKDAYFIVDLQCYPPKGWDKLFPDDMCLDDKGEVNKDGGRLNHSFATQNFVPMCMEYMSKALDYLEHCPYANRIIGYRVTGGHTLEWLGWDPKPGRMVDFSKATQAGFDEYMAQNYPDVEDTSIPSLAERGVQDGEEILWNQREHLKEVAFADYYSNAVVDIMIPLCKHAKAVLGPDKVVGLYYGYTMTLGASGRSHARAHYALKRVLEENCLDFIISPHPYGLRNIGDIMGDMKPFATLEKHGVVPVIEEDSRTFRGKPGLGYFQMINPETSIQVTRRNMADTLCRNYQYYFYSLSSGYEFDFKQAEEDQAAMRTVGQHCVEKGIPRGAEVALVVSEETIKAMPMISKSAQTGGIRQSYNPDGTVRKQVLGSTVFAGESLEGNYIRWAQAGVPVDYVLAEDLADNPGDYKLYVFVNCIKHDDRFIEAVEKLRERECTLMWCYAPGYYYGLDSGVEFMERLTGIRLEKADGALMPAVRMPDGRWLGTVGTRVAPMFYVTDEAAQSVGSYEDGSIGLAVKQTGNAKSIFCGPWQFDIPFLLRVLQDSGVHVFSKTLDPVDANSALFTLHARYAGPKHIELPHKTDVIDIFNKTLVGTNIDAFDYEAPLHETRFFYYGDDAKELLERLR